jgi:Glycosyl hydrolases family 39
MPGTTPLTAIGAMMNEKEKPVDRPRNLDRSLFRARYMSRRDTLRHLIAGAGGLLTSGAIRVTAAEAIAPPVLTAKLIDSALPKDAGMPVHSTDFGLVGVYDIDWLVTPEFSRLLDNLAASPRAFRGVRFFGALTSGMNDVTWTDLPTAGSVWPVVEAPMDFSKAFHALEALTSRGLTPFLGLTFFPPAVSPSPIAPPTSFNAWQALIRAFLEELAAHFGSQALRTWWFEVWNEPNVDSFWAGDFEDYLNLYRATSDVVLASGIDIRLGGPALAYLLESSANAGRPTMERFLRFLNDEPGIKCDFLSLHAKGTFGVDTSDVRRPLTAATETADLALAIDPARFADLPIVNDEADMKVGFDVPFEPRMTEEFPAWLAAVMAGYQDLDARYAAAGFRFIAASDNANLQLVRAPFDGRRSIVTHGANPAELLKVPVYNFYELLPLLGEWHGTTIAGEEISFPRSELVHAITVAPSHLGSLWAVYPRSPDTPPRACAVNYVLTDVPWSEVNISRFQIDRTKSNSYTAAGRTMPAAIGGAEAVRRIRFAQELSTIGQIRRGVTLSGGEFHESFTLEPYSTMLYWITPVIPDVPVAPEWIETTFEDGDVLLRWTPNREPFFYTYEVFLMQGDAAGERLTPEPLRAALWVDTAPPSGMRVYAVRAITASGVSSSLVPSAPVEV